MGLVIEAIGNSTRYFVARFMEASVEGVEARGSFPQLPQLPQLFISWKLPGSFHSFHESFHSV